MKSVNIAVVLLLLSLALLLSAAGCLESGMAPALVIVLAVAAAILTRKGVKMLDEIQREQK